MNYFDGVRFLGCGSNERHTTVHARQRFNGYYGIQYNHRGRLDFGVGGNGPLKSVDGSWAFVTYPGETFYYGAPEGESRHHVFICFKGERVERLIQGGLLVVGDENPLKRIVRAERFLATMLELIELVAVGPVGQPRGVLLLEDLLLQFHEQPPDEQAVNLRLRTSIDKIMDEIRSAPHLEWCFQDEAERLGVSYPHFRRMFSRLVGMPPWSFVVETRLQKAAKLLLLSGDQISVVAENCGFSDPFYFSRLFRKRFHLSPLSYRKEFQAS